MLESSIEKQFIKCAQKLGGRAIKLHRTGRRGEVDRLLALPFGVVVWLELKRPGQKPRASQKRIHAWLRRKGHKVLVSDGTNLPQAFTYLHALVTMAARRA